MNLIGFIFRVRLWIHLMVTFSADWKLSNWLRLLPTIFATKWWSTLRKKKTIWKSKEPWTTTIQGLEDWLRTLRILARLEVPLKSLLNRSKKTTIRRPSARDSSNPNLREGTWCRSSETTKFQIVVAVLRIASAVMMILSVLIPLTTLQAQLSQWKSTGHTGKKSSDSWFLCSLIWEWFPKTRNASWFTPSTTLKSLSLNPKRIRKGQLFRWFPWTGDR